LNEGAVHPYKLSATDSIGGLRNGQPGVALRLRDSVCIGGFHESFGLDRLNRLFVFVGLRRRPG